MPAVRMTGMDDIFKKKAALFKKGEISESDFLEFLHHFPYKDMGNIKLDFHRRFRRGLPEVIYGGGKSLDQLRKIASKYSEIGEKILITRVDEEKAGLIVNEFNDLVFNKIAGTITSSPEEEPQTGGKILVLTAGASDEGVGEEAYVSSVYLGNATDRQYDVGVACINRILDLKDKLDEYSVLIVVAGMEGALPSVVAGLTSTPVIAVPTSVGYGANLNGIAALLSMLNSCAGGISVVNVDNGFGAAYQATLINKKIAKQPENSFK